MTRYVKKRWVVKTGLVLCLVGALSTTYPQIINSGNVTLWAGAFPTDLRADKFENDAQAYLFTEHRNLTLSEDVIVNAVDPGLYDDDADLGQFTISAGTVVNVYLLRSDPVGNGPRDYSGSITFSNERIIGVIARGRRLRLTDRILGVSGTQYSQSDTLRGYELDTQDVEQFKILPDRRTLEFYARTTNVVDELRIVTVNEASGGEPCPVQTINFGNVRLWSGSPPSDLRADQFEDDDWAYLFIEHLNLILPADMVVNAISPGLYDQDADLGSFTIPAGTKVDVYLLHSDPVGNGPRDYSGSITFSNEIIGVIARGRRLRLSDPVLGAPGVLYSQSDNYRGYELDTQPTEWFEIQSDRRTVIFSCRTTNVVDELRIVTRSCP